MTLAALVLTVVAALSLIGGARAFFGSDDKTAYFAEDGIAIRGYDPVAYFDQGAPVKGSAEHSLTWQGVTWQFASAAHRQAFQDTPEKYAPAYGGYCAYAVAKDQLASIDPTAWRIVDGKLYLNYSASIQDTWEEDIPGYIKQAEINWPDLDPARQ
ncbi:YHS domain-containing protein [Rhodovibrio salinarum]|uniref:YHS domain-containing protein n=1 Tax=Rhodovibrio salinarum TaxID=1087 RepID=A0A934QKK2_9PROT|nr:YHS domain-containing protein [Rhodovibrio salinarum]